jgi:hypothetical protein
MIKNFKSFTCLTIAILLLACGCNPVGVLLKGNYSDQPTLIFSTKSIDSSWSNLNELFTRKGLAIKKIDTTNGLIITKEIPINAAYTFENKDGQLENPEAWVVLTKVFNKKKQWKPKRIYGQWSIQISELEPGTSTIKIEPTVMCTFFPNFFTSMHTQAQSTGELEELVAKHFK